MIFAYIPLFVFSAYILVRAAKFLVDSLTIIGRHHKVGEFAISFILVAFATSIPELLVSVMSVGADKPELAIGTVLGSSISVLTLIIGLATIYARKIRIKSIIKKKDILYMLGICIVLVFLMMDGSLTRWDSAILFLIYGYYLYRLVIQEKKFESAVVKIGRPEYSRAIGYFIVSIVALILSSKLLVWVVENISATVNIPVTLMGMVVVAIGTTLPELSFEIAAVKAKEQDMVLGNIIGSVVTNSTLLIGVIGFLNPINNLDLQLINIGLFFLIAVALVLFYFVKNDGKLTFKEGVAMVLSYLVFVTVGYIAKLISA